MGFEKGNKLGKGRPPKADEEKVNQIFINALKEMYSSETDEDAKKTFVKDTLMDSQRGQLFIAEHIFGKAPQEVKQTNLNIDATDLTEEEVLRIKTALDNAY
jgi:hypothetical protein